MNPFEASARATKCAGLIAAIQSFSAYRGRAILARDVLKFTEDEWEWAAFTARVTMPSIETRAMVLKELSERDAAVAAHNGRAQT